MSNVDTIHGFDPWTLALAVEMARSAMPRLHERRLADMTLEVRQGQDSVWIIARWPGRGGMAFRTAYTPGCDLRVDKTAEDGTVLAFELSSSLGRYQVTLDTPNPAQALLHWSVTLTPSENLLLPFWPSDVYPLDADGDPRGARGVAHAGQAGPASGVLCLTLTEPASGTLLYLQNLTALNDLSRKTQTAPESWVGGLWPHLGYAPPQSKTHPLPKGQATVISDAWVRLSPLVPADERQVARFFLDALAEIYPYLERPEPQFHDWIHKSEETLRDLTHSSECTLTRGGHRFLYPYTKTEEPDSMVQLTVLLPLIEYAQWTGRDIPLTRELRAGIPDFYDKKLRTLRRYLPSVGTEKNADAVDSWYLYHPLSNLARLALMGDAEAKDLFFNCVDYSIKAARHFHYCWPVQFNVETLEVITGDRKPGEPGQSDVGGIYAYVMLQAWDLSGDTRYLDEAKKAMQALRGYAFSLNYQLNLTAWGANACLRLWRITGDEIFRDQSYVFFAGYFHHAFLWNSELGWAKHYPIFMGALCLHDSFYMAIYECYESFCGLREYLTLAGTDAPDSIRLLLSECCKYTPTRAWYYYPAELPKEALATEVRNGHVDRALAIPLEDLYADGRPAGAVGQEVYGSGAAFAFVTRNFYHLPDAPFVAYCEYPLQQITRHGAGFVSFSVDGDSRFPCRLRLLPAGRKPLPSLHVCVITPQGEFILEGIETDTGHREYTVTGGSGVEIKWG